VKKCPYCLAELEEEAAKCRHCGEWVKEAPAHPEASLGRAANRFVTFTIVWAVVVLVLMLVFFLAFFLPRFDSMRSMRHESTPPHQAPQR